MKLTPKIYAAALVGAVEGATPAEVTKAAKRLWLMVWQHRHWSWRQRIINEVADLWRRRHGQRLATVSTAKPLTVSEHTALTKSLTQHLGSKVELATVVKPHLLGGAVITIEDERFDASLKGRLDALYHALAGE